MVGAAEEGAVLGGGAAVGSVELGSVDVRPGNSVFIENNVIIGRSLVAAVVETSVEKAGGRAEVENLDFSLAEQKISECLVVPKDVSGKFSESRKMKSFIGERNIEG